MAVNVILAVKVLISQVKYPFGLNIFIYHNVQATGLGLAKVRYSLLQTYIIYSDTEHTALHWLLPQSGDCHIANKPVSMATV